MSDTYNKKIAESIQSVLSEIGENPEREGLLKTPERVAKSMGFLTNGYKQNPTEILKSAMFAEDYSQMVLVKDIELYSMCEHHLLPFIGKAHVAYISSGKVIGLSKLNRLVEYFSKRPQVVLVVGVNGSGKTTLFNLIAGNLKTSSGSVSFDQENITDVPSYELFSKGLLRTFQIAHEFTNLTVLENLMMVPGNQSGESLVNALLKPALIKIVELIVA